MVNTYSQIVSHAHPKKILELFVKSVQSSTMLKLQNNPHPCVFTLEVMISFAIFGKHFSLCVPLHASAFSSSLSPYITLSVLVGVACNASKTKEKKLQSVEKEKSTFIYVI